MMNDNHTPRFHMMNDNSGLLSDDDLKAFIAAVTNLTDKIENAHRLEKGLAPKPKRNHKISFDVDHVLALNYPPEPYLADPTPSRTTTINMMRRLLDESAHTTKLNVCTIYPESMII